MLSAILIILTAAYLLFHLMLHQGLSRHQLRHSKGPIPKVSVIIAARNEEQDITFCLGSLLCQTYDHDQYEVIVVDDHSQDRTAEIVRACAQKFANIRLVSSPPLQKHISPKKAAIAAGIHSCSGEILLFTDADCIVPRGWIEGMVQGYDDNTGAVASWVLPPAGEKLLSQIEILDVLAYQLLGAGTIGMGRPFLANGANFSYRRDLFVSVNGFKDIQKWGSGDDDLFLQKLYQQTRQKTIFLQDASTLVITSPNHRWRDFFRQRIRWSSKIKTYNGWLRLLACIAYLYYCLLLLAFPLAVLGVMPYSIAFGSLMAKFGAEAILLHRGTKMVGRPFHLLVLLVTAIVHLCYIPVIGILGFIGHFSWKNRRYRRGILVDF